jgi:hypothetical protein
MNPARAVDSTQPSAPWLGLVLGGLIAGTMDITAALVVYGHYGLTPIRLLQGIAAGLLGPRAFEVDSRRRYLDCSVTSSSHLAPRQSFSWRAARFRSWSSTRCFQVFSMAWRSIFL